MAYKILHDLALPASPTASGVILSLYLLHSKHNDRSSISLKKPPRILFGIVLNLLTILRMIDIDILIIYLSLPMHRLFFFLLI